MTLALLDFEVAHDSGEIGKNEGTYQDVYKRRITGSNVDLGAMCIEIYVNKNSPHIAHAKLSLWTGLGWADAAYRFGEELTFYVEEKQEWVTLSSDAIAISMYEEVLHMFGLKGDS